MNRAIDALGHEHVLSEIPAHGATDASLYHTVFYAPRTCHVTDVTLEADAAITGADSPYSAYFQLFPVGADGTPLQALADRNYSLGTDEAAMVARAMYTAGATPLAMAAGQSLAIQRERIGAGGLATPRFTVLTGVAGL